MQSAAKVGALVVVFGVLLYLAFVFLGRTLFGGTRDVYYAVFTDVTGIRAGTPVTMAGVPVGEVTKLNLTPTRQARLTLLLDKDSKVYVGSTASIASSLIGIGESPISIDPPIKPTDVYLEPGSTIYGKQKNALDSVLPEGRQTVAELTKTLKAMRVILEDKRLVNHVDSLMTTTQQTAKSIGELTSRVDSLLATNQGTLTSSLQQLSVTLDNMRRITAQVARMAEDPNLRRNATAILSQMNVTSKKVDRIVTNMGKVANDPAFSASLSQAATNVAQMTETGKRIADNTERITANGAVISEKAIGVTEQVSQIASQASDIASDVKQLTNRVSGILNPKPHPGALSQLHVGMDLMHEFDPSYWRADFSGQIPFQDSTVHFGLYDAFGTNRMTLQLGNMASPALGYRYGIYAGKAGVGVDYRVAPRVSLRSDFWDLNHPRLDVRARYDFGNGLIGWLGIDRLFKDNTATIGIGVRR